MTHPAKWFAVAAALLLIMTPLISMAMASAGDVDLLLRHTYYVLPASLVCFAMAALLALFAGAYSIFPFSSRGAAWHFWLTSASIAVFWLSFYVWGARTGGRLGTQALMSPSTPALETAIAATFVLSTLVVLVSPAIFVINLAIEWARRHRLLVG